VYECKCMGEVQGILGLTTQWGMGEWQCRHKEYVGASMCADTCGEMYADGARIHSALQSLLFQWPSLHGGRLLGFHIAFQYQVGARDRGMHPIPAHTLPRTITCNHPTSHNVWTDSRPRCLETLLRASSRPHCLETLLRASSRPHCLEPVLDRTA
jgi:hypothetical protein